MRQTKKNCVQPKAEKQYVINKCRRQLYEGHISKCHRRKLRFSFENFNVTYRKKVLQKHFHDRNCSQKMKDFLMSNIINDTIPHFYIVWKILKSPPLECPIIAGYKWILRPAPICAGMLERNFMCCLIH